jgi:signal transduction histidine kinase
MFVHQLTEHLVLSCEVEGRRKSGKTKNECMKQNLLNGAWEKLHSDASPLVPVTDWREMGEREHFVQFYEDDTFLVHSVAAFITTGLQAGDAAIVIATEAHRLALDQQLQEQGLDLAALRERGQYFPLDAAETLSKFMVEGEPDKDRFDKVVGSLVARTARGGRRVRAFGEMVALLWGEGNGDAAIRLEQLWNELAKAHSFCLFCAYPMNGFQGAANGQPFVHICHEHSRVIPAESYGGRSDPQDRLRAISLLQQKASSLDAEIAVRKHAESTTDVERTKLSMAVTVAGLGIWELDLVSNAFICSEQSKVHAGFPPQEFMTRERFFELIHPDDRLPVQDALRAAIAGNGDFNVEYRVIDRHKGERWVVAMGRCFHNGSHRLLGVTLDITERKRAAEILERTVVERTAELHATINELEAFSYSISHDMRAPLRSMRGFADILLKECSDKLNPECRGYLERICSAGGRMDRLIQDVLTFSRVAKTELTLEPINLDHLVRGIVECYPDLQRAEVLIDGTLPKVWGNAAALTQCLSNLLGNAVKFVAPGTQPIVRVWSESMDAFEEPDAALDISRAAVPGTVRLFIQDNGIGIPREAQDKIFAIFQRLAKGYEGTGIGLAIVKKAAERMGGKVGVISEPGRGSTFWLQLKAVDVSRIPA